MGKIVVLVDVVDVVEVVDAIAWRCTMGINIVAVVNVVDREFGTLLWRD